MSKITVSRSTAWLGIKGIWISIWKERKNSICIVVLKDGFLENIKPNSVLLFLRNLFCCVNTAHFQAQVFNEIRCLSFLWLDGFLRSLLLPDSSQSPLQSKESAVCMLRIFQVLFQKILINCGQHTNNSLWQKLQALSNFVVGNCHLFCFYYL